MIHMIQQEKNRCELTLKEWEASVDVLPQLILMLDARGNIVRGNNAVERWELARTPEIKGLHYHRLFHPLCTGDCYLNLLWIPALEKLHSGQSLQMEQPDIILNKHISIQIHPVQFREGCPPPESNVVAVAVFEDITSGGRLEEKIRRAASDLHGIFEVLPDRYLRVDKHGAILAYKSGTSDDEFFVCRNHVGRNIRECLPESFREKFLAAITAVLESGTLQSLEYTVTTPRSERIYEGRFVPLFDNQVDIISRDITETKKLRSIAESLDMMKNLGYIFSGIRHEIGNPINSIKMTVSVLKNNLDQFSRERVLEYMDRVFIELGRVEYLLKNFKTFNMFEELTPVDVFLDDFMSKLFRLLENDFQGKGIRLTLEVDSDARRACVDPRALHQVMLNIIGNAVEALEGAASPAISIKVSRENGSVLIAVRDNGPGIREEILPEVFRPFFTTKSHGAGLGLSIVQKILSRMGGAVRLSSRFGEGAAAVIEIPEGHHENT